MSDGVDPYPGDPSCACNVCGRLKDVDDQLRTAQALVANLLRTRQLVATQINSTHNQDLFRRMPSEVLGHIFEDCGPSYALRVGAVCRKWRRIAWSTPQLWTIIDIRLVNNRTSLNSTLIFAREWLNRSGQLPLTIHITGSATSASSLQMNGMKTIIKLINEYAHRWQDLQLKIPAGLLQGFRSDPQGRSVLRNLTIVCRGQRAPYSFRPQHARLRPSVVHIEHWFRLVDIEWNNVTQVEVDFPVDECLEMLRRAPKVMDCKLIDIFVDPFPTYPFPVHRIVHPNLKSLSVSVSEPESPPLLFHHISFPSLCELRYDWSGAIERNEEFLAFLACSSSYLHILHLDVLEMQDSALMPILQTTRALTDLDLRTHSSVHDNFFQLLADSSLAGADNDSTPFLPRLRCFKYRCFSTGSRDFLPKLFGPLSEIGNPHRRPLSKISLILSPSLRGSDVEKPNIDETVALQILELQHRGMQLEVSYGEEDVLEASLKAHRLLPA